MKHSQLKFTILFALILICGDIIKIPLIHHNNTHDDIAIGQLIGSDLPEKKCMHLEFRKSNSKPEIQGEINEPIVISYTYSNHSEIRFINLSILQKIVCSKEDYSLSSAYYLFISQTFCISTLINLLRI